MQNYSRTTHYGAIERYGNDWKRSGNAVGGGTQAGDLFRSAIALRPAARRRRPARRRHSSKLPHGHPGDSFAL